MLSIEIQLKNFNEEKALTIVQNYNTHNSKEYSSLSQYSDYLRLQSTDCLGPFVPHLSQSRIERIARIVLVLPVTLNTIDDVLALRIPENRNKKILEIAILLFQSNFKQFKTLPASEFQLKPHDLQTSS